MNGSDGQQIWMVAADILNEPSWKETQSDQANLGLGVGQILHPNTLHFIVVLELVVWILSIQAER